jgi:short-subunit dehydrogenase
MRANGGGRIVNIASIGGKVSVPHLLPYSTSKFALVGFSEGLRSALLKDRIYVTTAIPGLMRTGSPRNASFKGQNEAEYALFKLADSLPVLSMNADRAARQILEACQYGDAETVLSMPAKLATVVQGLFPGLTADLAGVVNWMLPGPGGILNRRTTGARSETRYSSNVFTKLTDRAARQNNEMGH